MPVRLGKVAAILVALAASADPAVTPGLGRAATAAPPPPTAGVAAIAAPGARAVAVRNGVGVRFPKIDSDPIFSDPIFSARRAAAAEAPRVVVSIAPIQSLVAGVMAGVGVPKLIVRGYGSPHHYQMRPSEAAALARADLVFWVGPALETFLERPLASLAREARIVELLALEGVTRYPARPGGVWERPAAAAAGVGVDPHLWLDADNARRIVAEAVRRLSAADPANAPAYGANGAAVMRRLEATDRALRRRLQPVRDVPYVVAHDAFQYFERRYGLRPVGSLTLAPERLPGARRIRELKAQMAALGVRCVLREPQFETALIDTIVEGTGTRRGVVDPIGAGFAPGPDAYFEMMHANAAALVTCLGG